MSDGRPAAQNIQDAFLNTVRREKTTVMVYLVNGAKLTGRIRSFDKFSILLEAGSQEQLIFKHAISTISQSRRGSGDLRPHASAENAGDQTNRPPSPLDNQAASQPLAPTTGQPANSPES
jgi:host factor-I protein